MAFIQLMAKAIGKIWSFLTKLILIAIIIAFVIFIAMMIVPDDVLRAIEIIKGLFSQGGANCGQWLRNTGI